MIVTSYLTKPQCGFTGDAGLSDQAASDESLMLATGEGDMEAFAEIVRRHQSAAWGVAYRFTGDATEAEDLVQETFLRLLNAAGRYRPIAAFQTYLYRILTRLCIDHGRKNRPIPTDSPPDIPDTELSQSERLERKEQDLAVSKALEALPPKYRMVIVLRYFEGLSGSEMAKVLKTTPKGVERLLARARSKLEPLLRPLL